MKTILRTEQYSFVFKAVFLVVDIQVQASDENTMFVEHAIQVLKQILENNTEEDESAEHLGVMSIEELILAIVR